MVKFTSLTNSERQSWLLWETPPFFRKGQRIKQPSKHISTSHIQENVQSQINRQNTELKILVIGTDQVRWPKINFDNACFASFSWLFLAPNNFTLMHVPSWQPTESECTFVSCQHKITWLTRDISQLATPLPPLTRREKYLLWNLRLRNQREANLKII